MGRAKGTQGTLKTMVMSIFSKPGVRCIAALQIQHTTLEISFIYVRFDFKKYLSMASRKISGLLTLAVYAHQDLASPSFPAISLQTSPTIWHSSCQPHSTFFISLNIQWYSLCLKYSFHFHLLAQCLTSSERLSGNLLYPALFLGEGLLCQVPTLAYIHLIIALKPFMAITCFSVFL